MPVGQLLIAVVFTLFGAMLALVVTLVISNRRLRRDAIGARIAPVVTSFEPAIERPAARAVVEPLPRHAGVDAVMPKARLRPDPAASAARWVDTISPEGMPELVFDAIDPVLFPVFEEEATELLQRLGNDLRQWESLPDDSAPRGSMLNALQMLKGSARVVGAMQLGDHAHRLELEIEVLGRRPISPASLRKLVVRFDTLQTTLDSLRAAWKGAAPELVHRADAPAELPPTIWPGPAADDVARTMAADPLVSPQSAALPSEATSAASSAAAVAAAEAIAVAASDVTRPSTIAAAFDQPATDDVTETLLVPAAEITAAGSPAAKSAAYTLDLPLTTAVAHVVMLRAGTTSIGVQSNLVEFVDHLGAIDLDLAYARQTHSFRGEEIPFFWVGAFLKTSERSEHAATTKNAVVIVHSATQRVALHVDEVIGDQELLVKNIGPQLSRLPAMGGISVMAAGAVALIYNPTALAAVHNGSARAMQDLQSPPKAGEAGGGAKELPPPEAIVPLILVVDDSITVRRVAQRLLQREGYRVSLAVDGLHALSRLQEERPAVVLSDIEMPIMDGFDLARNIRADGALAGLPIIMITSRIAEKHRLHARQLGVNHYLGKPYAEEELIRLVRMYTGKIAATVA